MNERAAGFIEKKTFLFKLRRGWLCGWLPALQQSTLFDFTSLFIKERRSLSMGCLSSPGQLNGRAMKLKWNLMELNGMECWSADGLRPITHHKPQQSSPFINHSSQSSCLPLLIHSTLLLVLCWRNKLKLYYNSKLTRKVYRQ